MEKGHAQGQAEAATSYSVPNHRVGLPFEPSRTLEVAEAHIWQAYAKPNLRRRSVFGLPVLSPFSRWVDCWDSWCAFVDLTYTAFLVPVSIAFSTTAYIDWLVGLDIAATAIYALDICIQLHTGFVLRGWDSKRHVVLDGPTVARYYLRHSYFCWDAPAVLAIIPEAILLGSGGGSVAWKIWYMLRMLRLLRIARLAMVVWSAALSCHNAGPLVMFYLTTASLYGLAVLWALFVIVNALGCFLWWLAEVQGVDSSWPSGPYITQPQLHMGLLTDQSDVVKWLYSTYWALSAVTTAVYGDAIPTTVPEIVTIMVYDFFSVFWWSAIVTLIFEVVQVVSRKARKASALVDRLNEVEGWMQERLLPPDLQQKVRRYYTEVWGPMHAGEEVDMLVMLPAALRGEVVWRAAGSTLCAVPLLRCLPLEVLQWLATRAGLVKLLAGHDLFVQGAASDGCLYVLQAGEVAVLRGWRRVATVSSPAVIGQAALLPILLPEEEGGQEQEGLGTDWRQLNTVRAVTNCILWSISVDDLAMLLEDLPGSAQQLCRAYMQYLDGLPAKVGAEGLPPRAAALRTALASAAAVGRDGLAAVPRPGSADRRSAQPPPAVVSIAAGQPLPAAAARGAAHHRSGGWEGWQRGGLPPAGPSSWGTTVVGRQGPDGGADRQPPSAAGWLDAAAATFIMEAAGSVHQGAAAQHAEQGKETEWSDHDEQYAHTWTALELAPAPDPPQQLGGV